MWVKRKNGVLGKTVRMGVGLSEGVTLQYLYSVQIYDMVHSETSIFKWWPWSLNELTYGS